MTNPDLEQHLHQLGQHARDLWLAGATQHDVLVHVAVSLGGWHWQDDPRHLRLIRQPDAA
jgi:hypothetical protein